jgi:hypothetical protein
MDVVYIDNCRYEIQEKKEVPVWYTCLYRHNWSTGPRDIKVNLSHYTPWRRLGGEEIAPTHSRPRHWIRVSGQRHVPDALYPQGKDPPGTHCTVGWVDPRAGLDTEVRGKILCTCRGSNPDRPLVQPVVRHYTD